MHNVICMHVCLDCAWFWFQQLSLRNSIGYQYLHKQQRLSLIQRLQILVFACNTSIYFCGTLRTRFDKTKFASHMIQNDCEQQLTVQPFRFGQFMNCHLTWFHSLRQQQFARLDIRMSFMNGLWVCLDLILCHTNAAHTYYLINVFVYGLIGMTFYRAIGCFVCF